MGDTTKISWTQKSWNPFIGCKAVSPGCGLGEGNGKCYAEAWAHRRGWKFANVVRTKTWRDPARWQKAAAAAGRTELVFTCSLSDFFIENADPWRAEAWKVIRETPNLIYQILTKRPGLVEKRLPPDWGTGYPNVWLGVSMETKAYLWRLDTLRRIPATLRFVSAEPLMEDLCPEFGDHLEGYAWVIVGGQSGNRTRHFRPMDHQWVRNIRDLCRRRAIAMFFKQSSGFTTETGVQLDGELVREYPQGHGAPSGEVG